ncbi:unnamed protein product [Orchesella dallaii]|uniref:Galactosylgalactosylxylosylprotein 3-beta-glucuronosyltransferase n=1 Tax=Orchesella dallaii TaxID=48710 RepID=A0ABP1Q4K4_9HEXA
MLISKVRRILSKNFVAEIVLPFALGFCTVVLFFWLNRFFAPEEVPFNKTLVATFTDKNGQVYLKRHGMQDEADIYRLKTNKLRMSIRADAGNGFQKQVVYSKRFPFASKMKSPPGEIWSWPRIEEEADPEKLVWVVTPTYRYPYQYPELTRIAQALYPARKFVRWLIADDHTKSKGHPTHKKDLRRLLNGFNINFTLITSRKRPKNAMVVLNPKGVDARQAALNYIRQRKLKGTVYFADDDNTYDSDIFRQIQDTKTVSVWPTGLLTQWIVSAPVVNAEGMVIDFFDKFRRRFSVDFASFAINCSLLHENENANIPWIQGYEETKFLEKLGVDISQFQPLAANATEVLTWHTKTRINKVQKKIDIVLHELDNWPLTAQNLVKKYQMLFDVSGWEVPKKPKKSKKKGKEDRNNLSSSPKVTPSVSQNLMKLEPTTITPIIIAKDDNNKMSINSLTISPNIVSQNPLPPQVEPNAKQDIAENTLRSSNLEPDANRMKASENSLQQKTVYRISGIQDDIHNTEALMMDSEIDPY